MQQPGDERREGTKSKLLPFKAACEAAPCSPPKMYQLIRMGRVKAYKIGNRTFIDEDSLHEGVRAEPLVLGLPKPTPGSIAAAKKRAAAKVEAAKPKARRAHRNAERRAAST